MSTITLPALPSIKSQPLNLRNAKRPQRDPWLILTLIAAAIASVAADIISYANQAIVLYSDAHSHLLAARRVLDNVNPGLAQLGSVWLPLPHALMLPFIWVDGLWRTGLAGTIVAFPCFIVATLAIFLTVRRLTNDSRASFIGALVFLLNPNILYLQSTPLSEPVLFATLAVASYYFVVWAQDGRTKYLLLTALWTMLATVARYDGWPLFLAFFMLIPIIGLIRRQPIGKIISDLVLYGILGGLGIALWFLWNLVLYGDPLYFAHGPFSSQQQTQHFLTEGVVTTYHSAWESIRAYSVAAMESIGPALFVLGVIAVVIFMARRRFSPPALAALTVLTPFPFYVLAFALGQDVMFVPHANHAPYVFYNARFGAEMAAPAGVFIGALSHDLFKRLRLAQLALVTVIVVQQAFIAGGGIISLQDGQYGLSCYVARPIAAYLAQHYDGGKVLMDTYHSFIDISVANMTFSDIIYEGDTAQWNHALDQPATVVNWIITAPGDLITARIDTASPTFLQEYTPVLHESDNLTLWRRADLGPMPDRPLPSDVLAPYHACSHVQVTALSGEEADPRQVAAMFVDSPYTLADTKTSVGA